MKFAIRSYLFVCAFMVGVSAVSARGQSVGVELLSADLAAPDGAALPVTVLRERSVSVHRAAMADGVPSKVRLTFFDDASFVLDVPHSRDRKRGRLSASGSLEGVDGGSYVLVVRDGRVRANVWAPGQGVFHLRERADGTYAARQINTAAFPACLTEDGPAGPGVHAAAGEPVGVCVDDGSVIDVFIVYTEAARIGEGGTAAMEMLVEMCEVSTNLAYSNSGISTIVNVVGSQEVVYTETGSSFLDRLALTDPADGQMDEVHDLRDTFGADVVSLLTDTLDGCGRAHFSILAGNVPVPSLGFNVCRRDCAVDNLTFAHELGHNQGCRHDRGADGSDDGAFLYSHGYIEPGGVFRTVMAVFTTGVDRVAHFSNPDVLFMGLPTGVPVGAADSAHNALSIDQTAFNVANFRPSVAQDCNNNGVDDSDDIINGTSSDENDNGVPDECEEGGVRYVDLNATGANTGLTWTDAFVDLQDALDEGASLCAPLSEIWVAAGTYTPDRGTGDRGEAFAMRGGVAIYGGFAGGETFLDERDPLANPTILSGDLNDDDGPGFANDLDNSYHVLIADGVDASSRLDGFTIIGGNADTAGSENNNGGGMLVRTASPTIVKCTFRGNQALTGGGAMYCRSGSDPLITGCAFLGNASGGGGGAMAINFASAPTLMNCVFSGNVSSSDRGGAVRVGGVDESTPLFANCTFSGNTGTNAGGIGNYPTGAPMLDNCILWGNSDNGGMDEDAQMNGGSPVVAYSCIQGLNLFAGSGNIGLDPLFVDADGPDNVVGTPDDDLRISAGSPVIDAGDNTAVTADDADLDEDGDTSEATPVDHDGEPRFADDPDTPDTGVPDGINPPVDMGAHEFQPVISCFGDLNGDLEVGFADILVVIANFGPCEGTGPGGTCCAGGECQVVFEAECAALGGAFTPFTLCIPGGCPDDTGACCLEDLSCTATLTASQCAAANGTFLGVGTFCTDVQCGFAGGKCCAGGGCTTISEIECAEIGGDFTPFAFCDIGGCPTNTGACCFTDDSCDATLTSSQCAAAGGAFFGVGTLCTTIQCGPITTCLGDLNEDGDVGFADILLVIANWGPCL